MRKAMAQTWQVAPAPHLTQWHGIELKMAQPITYIVETAPDDLMQLQQKVEQIGREGGKIVSVMWTPDRQWPDGLKVLAGYVIVAEMRNIGGGSN